MKILLKKKTMLFILLQEHDKTVFLSISVKIDIKFYESLLV